MSADLKTAFILTDKTTQNHFLSNSELTRSLFYATVKLLSLYKAFNTTVFF